MEKVDLRKQLRPLHQASAKDAVMPLERLHIEEFAEGRAAQILHVGPFSEEEPTIARLHEYLRGRSALHGRHHEIHLTDVRRTGPFRWKSILRRPME